MRQNDYIISELEDLLSSISYGDITKNDLETKLENIITELKEQNETNIP